jgi:ATP-dependent RNA helicase RhlE
LTDFQALGLNSHILKSLSALGFSEPTPIQAKAIPLALEGRDVMGLAQTGTGKTAAFGLPLIQHLSAQPGKPAPRTCKALILAPTRELVNQIATNLRAFTKGGPIKVNSVVGGVSIGAQIKALSFGSDIVVATPGRLLDLVKRQAIRLDSAKHLVLDEADQMLDLGFIHALREISRLVGQPRQTMLFSATMPKQMNEIASAYLTDPVRVEVSPPGRTADKITQSVHFVDGPGKVGLLKELLSADLDNLSLVFTRTKHGAEKLTKQLEAAGFATGSIHGNKSQGQRDRTLKSFRSGDIRVLVATDVAARGIDIPGVSHVYNFDLPQVADNYVHRIGRTARAGASGEAVALCSPDDFGLLIAIEKLTGLTVDTASGTRPERAPRGNGPKRAQGRGGKPAGAGKPNNGKAARPFDPMKAATQRNRKKQRVKRARQAA